jgi:hypothetical protein
MGVQTTESKALMESTLAPKQGTVRSILVVLPRVKWWCAFFCLGWYWLWTDQLWTDCGNFLFVIKGFSGTIRFRKYDRDILKLVEVFLV